jgi:hypothetical protein
MATVDSQEVWLVENMTLERHRAFSMNYIIVKEVVRKAKGPMTRCSGHTESCTNFT